VLGLKVRDLTGGFKAIHRRVLEMIDLPTIQAEGYVFQIEVTYRATKVGATVTEVPIVFRDRTAGSSKMSSRIALEAMLRVPSLRRQLRAGPPPPPAPVPAGELVVGDRSIALT
jgi:dolichol-phosphate mannosyltransferase